ncbi:MAG: hypothetical protein SGI90_04990 [Candidatus Eisenbacteria bacterium]|nr:hypothetical protein [Candidatus Eisenbacteria bacterium]
MIVRGEVGPQQGQGGQMNRAVGHSRENGRKSAHNAGCLNPEIGRLLREVESSRAVIEERGVSLGDVEASTVQDCQMRQQLRRRSAFLDHHAPQSLEEIPIIE